MPAVYCTVQINKNGTKSEYDTNNREMAQITVKWHNLQENGKKHEF